MPFVKIQLKEGCTSGQKEVLAKEIIKMMDSTDFASKDSIRVIYEYMKPEDFYSGTDLN